jgi:hypothetical protein
LAEQAGLNLRVSYWPGASCRLCAYFDPWIFPVQAFDRVCVPWWDKQNQDQYCPTGQEQEGSKLAGSLHKELDDPKTKNGTRARHSGLEGEPWKPMHLD